ncbi:MAG: hypothetical protein KGQ41_03955 [Alphaproteobacteria bacterium]|nr:hypothetical protein [Alphaproteobacteria bacterium]
MLQKTPTTLHQTPSGNTQEDAKAAAKFSRKLHRAFSEATIGDLYDFIHENLDFINNVVATKKSPRKILDMMDKWTSSFEDKVRTKKQTKHMRREMIGVLRQFQKKADPKQSELVLDALAALLDDRRRRHLLAGRALKRAGAHFIYPVTGPGGPARRILSVPHRLAINSAIATSANLLDAGLSFLGIGKWTRASALVIGVATGGAVLTQYEVDAAPFMGTMIKHIVTMDHFNAQCHPPEIWESGDKVLAAYAVVVGNKGGAGRRMIYGHSMRALPYGVSPLAVDSVSGRESNYGRNLKNPKSTAEGPDQTLVGTKMDWLRLYAKSTPFYQAAAARIASKTAGYDGYNEDYALIRGVDELIKLARKDPKTYERLGKEAKAKAPYAHFNQDQAFIRYAVELANNSDFAGDLISARIGKRFPSLLAEKVKDMTIDQFMVAVSGYYNEHLHGDTGGAFAKWVADNHPNTIMGINPSDEATAEGQARNRAIEENLTKLFKVSPYRHETKFAAQVGEYYTTINERNGHVHPKGAFVTATQYQQDIIDWMASSIKREVSPVFDVSMRGNSVAEVCANDLSWLRQQFPAKVTYGQVTLKVVWNSYVDNTPNWLRPFIDDNAVAALDAVNGFIKYLEKETKRQLQGADAGPTMLDALAGRLPSQKKAPAPKRS